MMRKRMWTALSAAAGAVALSLTATPASASTAELPSFRVGIQLSDDRGRTQFGAEQFTRYAKFGNSVSPWAGDANGYDPDAVLIDLNTTPGSQLGRTDFRIGAQAMDGNGHYGPVQYSPWASEGGGESPVATDDNGYDPDKYRLFLDSRAWPISAPLLDFRLSVTVVDGPTSGVAAVTPWASQGGGRSEFAVDDNSYDFDGLKVGIEVQ
ncbi:hypothetical protein LRS74_03075 [Streptomyces sp. LX-29]|uniref:hypothetical protein n=1 Tax=Streptomyces sp. LX-29 TaxID=2900152 RepID=UPI00240D12AB|nr:hypothetical protein [Streptomyces sp. LX-29]WFB06135.1 hypothetical protein LRS74_03075 [Streptomyces sp. LX-29]